MRKIVIIVSAIIVFAGAVLVYFFVFHKNLKDKIVIPYIAHQKPWIDPHLPGDEPIADKLDEVIFDGIFNIAANPSGIIYEDGLGELMDINENYIVSVHLKPKKRWHSNFNISMEKNKINMSLGKDAFFTAQDIKFTLRRIQKLGSLSPDYILISQAVENFDFTGPDQNDKIYFQFRKDRIWSETDVKEVLSFKILPAGSEMNAINYDNGTGAYMRAGEYKENIYFYKNPANKPFIANIILKPFIDNSTYTTEIKNRNINVLLSTPFGSVCPILSDSLKFFYKSNIATCFFAVFFNSERLNLEQRLELRKLISNRKILERFFRIGTEQQRHIADYKGPGDNYEDYLNYSVFPTTTYYVEEKVVTPLKDYGTPTLSVLPDTVRIKTCVNFGFREELSELVEIISDPSLFGGRIKATAVSNEEIQRGDYDGVLVPVSGYRSNFLFDLYEVFLREPDFAAKRINLITATDTGGNRIIDERSFESNKNFFRLDLGRETPEKQDIKMLLDYIYGFMSTSEIGDKQAYAQYIDELDQKIAMAGWLFSMPSLAYFHTQFDAETIDLYGIASQLSTIEKWQEAKKN
ncbi:MAG: hypothetical protein AB1633_08485 [Elusimicrobiota bacterium]